MNDVKMNFRDWVYAVANGEIHPEHRLKASEVCLAAHVLEDDAALLGILPYLRKEDPDLLVELIDSIESIMPHKCAYCPVTVFYPCSSPAQAATCENHMKNCLCEN